MKNMLNIRICRALFAGALLTGLVTGCDNADLGALDNAAYIKEAQKASSTTVKVEDDGGKTSLTVRLGGKGDTETAFRFEMNPDVLERIMHLTELRTYSCRKPVLNCLPILS